MTGLAILLLMSVAVNIGLILGFAVVKLKLKEAKQVIGLMQTGWEAWEEMEWQAFSKVPVWRFYAPLNKGSMDWRQQYLRKKMTLEQALFAEKMRTHPARDYIESAPDPNAIPSKGEWLSN